MKGVPSLQERVTDSARAASVVKLPPTIAWSGGEGGTLQLLDQTLLPHTIAMRECSSVQQVWQAIRELCVRGAPAIGVAAAYGVCLGSREFRSMDRDGFLSKVRESGTYLSSSRPTAVNLTWAVRRITQVAEANSLRDSAEIWSAMLAEAHRIAREDADECRKIGEVGAYLIGEGMGILTHCNAGALATVAYGTALAPLYVAHERGVRFHVFADETRPLLQGARLTALELASAGIDVTVLCDNAAAALMSQGRVQLVIVGADRIAANGDTANKIGTYGMSLAARQHDIPFYVAAPRSTFDLSIATGRDIPIEERDEAEIRSGMGKDVVPAGVSCWNPAFDVTPASCITAFITPQGLLEPVSGQNIADFFGNGGCKAVQSC